MYRIGRCRRRLPGSNGDLPFDPLRRTGKPALRWASLEPLERAPPGSRLATGTGAGSAESPSHPLSYWWLGASSRRVGAHGQMIEQLTITGGVHLPHAGNVAARREKCVAQGPQMPSTAGGRGSSLPSSGLGSFDVEPRESSVLDRCLIGPRLAMDRGGPDRSAAEERTSPWRHRLRRWRSQAGPSKLQLEGGSCFVGAAVRTPRSRRPETRRRASGSRRTVVAAIASMMGLALSAFRSKHVGSCVVGSEAATCLKLSGR